MLNNSEIITINSTLTKVGKKRMAQNQFKISKVAFSDDGINYSLINDNLSDDDILIKRTPLLDVWKDGHIGLRNKIQIEGNKRDIQPNTYDDIGFTINDSGINNTDGVNFPNVDGSELVYTGLNGEDMYISTTNQVSIQYNAPNEENSSQRFITATLFDSSYFDIALTSKNAQSYMRLTDPNRFDDEYIKKLKDVYHNIEVIRVLQDRAPLESINMHMLDRNFISSYFIDREESDNISKTISVATQDEFIDSNTFSIYYKGNFGYNNEGTQRYETLIELLDEISGSVKYIKLSIVPKN